MVDQLVRTRVRPCSPVASVTVVGLTWRRWSAAADTHLYLELLLTTGSHSQCVSALVKLCGVRFTPDLDLEQDVPAQMAQVTGVSVPEVVPLDVKYKLLLALIHLGCLPLAEKVRMLQSLLECCLY